MLKKLFSILLVISICVGLLAGCGGGSGETENTAQSTGSHEDSKDTQQTSDSTSEGDTEATEGSYDTVTLNRDDITLVNAGETMVLYDGAVAQSEILWGSEDESIATFSDGIVTAVGSGVTVVYAEYEGVRSSCTVHCNLKENNPTTGGNTGTTTGSREPVLAAPTTQTVDSSFFDDAAFIGDSISLKLSYYAGDTGELGNAKFLVRGSYGVGNAVYDKLLMTYQGQEMKIEDALAAANVNKVFIMLGMNDIALYGIDTTIANWGTLVQRIRSTCPNIQIFIQSMTPIWTGGEKGSLNNKNMDAYNERLKAFAESNGCKFIDVAPYMKDSTGGLATRFCSDSYVHMTNEGAKTWIQVLKAYTGY